MYHWFGTFLSKSVSRVSLAIPPRLLHRSDRHTKKELAKELLAGFDARLKES